MQRDPTEDGNSSDPDDVAIDLAARSAVAQALWIKKRLGLSAVTWKDGHIVVIPSDEIVVDEDLLDRNGKRTFFTE